LQEFARALVADTALVIDEIRLERDIGFTTLQEAKPGNHRTQMLPLGLVEVSRTGIVAIGRGPEGM
jgi:acetolactate synthase small subunit